MPVFLTLKTKSGDFHRRFSFVYSYTDLILPKTTASVTTAASTRARCSRRRLRLRKPVATDKQATVIAVCVAVIYVALRAIRIPVVATAALTGPTTIIHADISTAIAANGLTAVIAVISVTAAPVTVCTICIKTRITHITHSIV